MKNRLFDALYAPALAVLAVLLFVGYDKSKSPEKDVTVGVVLSQTGPIAPYGKKALEGVRLAQDKLRSEGIQVTFVIEDAASTPKSAVFAFEKLVIVDKVPIVIGPESSGLAMALAPVANRRKVVLFAPTVATDAYTSKGDYTFRNWPSSKAIAEKMADVALTDLRLKKVAVVHINNEMGKSYEVAFNARYEAGGGNISLTEAYPADTTDFRQLLSNVARVQPDAVYLVGQVEMGHFLRQMQEMDLNLTVLSGIGIEDPKVKELAGDLINDIVYTAPGFDSDSPMNEAKKFDDAFLTKYGRPAEIFAACSYDAVMLVGNLIKEGKRSAEDFRMGLFLTRGFAGATGVISFDENGDVQKPISVKKVLDGKFVFLDDGLQPIRK